MLDGISAEIATWLLWYHSSTARVCCWPLLDMFSFAREVVVAWLLLRTVEKHLWWLIFKGSDSGFNKNNKKVPSAPKQGRFKDLMMLGKAWKTPLCFYLN